MNNIEALINEYDTDSCRTNEDKLKKFLKNISDQSIIEQIGMAEMSKIIYLLKLKYEKEPDLIPIENDLMFRIGETNMANMSYLAVYIHFLTVSDRILHIEGNVSVPADLPGDHSFYARVNGEKTDPEFKDCGLDLKLGSHVYEKRTVFSLSIPLTKQHYEIEFFNLVSDVECRHSRINTGRFSPIADCISNQYCVFDDWALQISGNRIICRHADKAEREKYEKRFRDEIKTLLKNDADWILDLREQYFKSEKNKKKPLWLIMDRTDRADDNGEVFFRYMQGHKEIDTCFVIDKECKDYQRLQKIGKVIPLYSKEHYLTVLLADCIISSQCNGYVENPFWEKAEYFRDIYHRPKLIFLQHGVIKDDMSRTLNRFHTNLSGFITSTAAEHQSILDYPYHYDREKVWLTGLPVLDELKNDEQRCVVIAPTWRMGLMRQEWNETKNAMDWVPNDDIKSSGYYQAYRSLLNDKELAACCRKNDYKLCFKPHPLIEPYIKDITEGTGVRFLGAETSYRDMLSMGNLMVTDYSSIAFEFAYLGKSTIYYQFDKKEFFVSHSYRQGYFDYEHDGFGEVCTDHKELVSLLISYIEKSCAVKEKYKKRIDDLYPFHGGACERIYKQIKLLSSEKEIKVEGLSGKDFVIRDLKKKIRILETENSGIQKKLDKVTEERDETRKRLGETEQAYSDVIKERNYLQHDLEETRKSFSFRLGYKLTTIPRKLRERIKNQKEQMNENL